MRRFKEKPNVVLVSETDSAHIPAGKVSIGEQRVMIRPSSYVRKNNFWVGLDLDETALDKRGPEPLLKEAA
jgi:ABC-type transport system involved in cytochrome c biogenesis ATPase subunit